MNFKTYLIVPAILLVNICLAQEGGIEGTITDDHNRGIPFATVFIKNSSLGNTADSAGKFSLKKVPVGVHLLNASAAGYEESSQEIRLGFGQSKRLSISLSINKALDEIVVTGVSRGTRVKENPVAVVSVSAKAIQQSTGSNIIDVLVKNVPGLNAVKTGPNISKPFIRGLGYNRVLTLYDGVRQEGQQWGDEHGIEVDAYNIDRAEVIKGPSSLMYGSDALAGVVNLMPWIPSNRDGRIHGHFSSEYQWNNGLIGNGLRLSSAGKHWLGAVRGSCRLAKNYQNSIDGRVYNTGFQEKNLSALLGYKSKNGFSHFNLSAYDNLQGIPDGSRDSLTRKYTKQAFEGIQDDIKTRPLVSNEELNSYQLSPLHQHIQHYRVYANNHYQLGQAEIDAQLAFQQNTRREYSHPTQPTQPGLFVRLNTFNYSLRYSASKFSDIESAIGISGMVQRNKSLAATDFPIPDYNLLDAGAFVHLKWKGDKWTVGGGLRYDLRCINWDNFYVLANNSGFESQVSQTDSSGARLAFAQFSKAFSGLSASLGATFEVNKNLSFKVNIARGYRAPNITEIGSNGLDPGAHIIYLGNRSFSPEFSLQEDVGMLFATRNFSSSISAFNNHLQDFIYLALQVDANGNSLVDAQGNKTYQYAQSAAQLYGLEASLALHPELLKGFVWDNALALVYGFNTDSKFSGKGNEGEYLPLIPPAHFTSALSFKKEVENKTITSIRPKLEIDYNAPQNRYLGLNNSETKTSGYCLVNFSVSTNFSFKESQNISLQFGINNVLDKAYQSALSRLKYFEYYASSPNAHQGIFGEGRNVFLKLGFEF